MKECKIMGKQENLEKTKKKITLVENQEMETCFSYATIISNGDALGLVFTYGNDHIDELDRNIVELTAQVLSKQLEN